MTNRRQRWPLHAERARQQAEDTATTGAQIARQMLQRIQQASIIRTRDRLARASRLADANPAAARDLLAAVENDLETLAALLLQHERDLALLLASFTDVRAGMIDARTGREPPERD